MLSMHNHPLKNTILSVSDFNEFIKGIVSNLGSFQVKGEITEMRISPNKGLFIKLSDGKSNLSVGGYAPTIKGVDLIEEGMTVIVKGHADLYVPYGSFSLSAHRITPEGEGSLAIAYQKLKEKLKKDGLFADEHKQELPKYIKNIALLTGKDSAAYSDFVKILKEHKLSINVKFFPVLVQGDKSAGEIIKTLKHVFTKEKVDAIVLTRGGGSLEDLSSFNDEDMIQTMFASPTPIIAGVGHEKDESLADFVADLRASTPSQAAYYIAKQNEDFLLEAEELAFEIHSYLSEKQNITISLANELISKIYNSLKQQQQHSTEKFTQITEQAETAFDNGYTDQMQKFESLIRIVKSYNFKSVLKRGFAMIRKDGKELSSIKKLKKDDLIDTLLYDGKVSSVVTNLDKYTFQDEQKN